MEYSIVVIKLTLMVPCNWVHSPQCLYQLPNHTQDIIPHNPHVRSNGYMYIIWRCEVVCSVCSAELSQCIGDIMRHVSERKKGWPSESSRLQMKGLSINVSVRECMMRSLFLSMGWLPSMMTFSKVVLCERDNSDRGRRSRERKNRYRKYIEEIGELWK